MPNFLDRLIRTARQAETSVQPRTPSRFESAAGPGPLAANLSVEVPARTEADAMPLAASRLPRAHETPAFPQEIGRARPSSGITGTNDAALGPAPARSSSVRLPRPAPPDVETTRHEVPAPAGGPASGALPYPAQAAAGPRPDHEPAHPIAPVVHAPQPDRGDARRAAAAGDAMPPTTNARISQRDPTAAAPGDAPAPRTTSREHTAAAGPLEVRRLGRRLPARDQPETSVRPPGGAPRPASLPDGDDRTQAPTIEVTIGRVEVRAMLPSASASRPSTRRPALGLDEYLRRRSEGRS